MSAVQSHPLATTRSVSTSQSADLFPCTRSAATSTYKPTLADYRRRWDPQSFGTKSRNGTLNLALNGFSLRHNWCDPNCVPLWALSNTKDLLEPIELEPTIEEFDDFGPLASTGPSEYTQTMIAINQAQFSSLKCEKNIVNQEKVSTNSVKGTKHAKITLSPGRGNSFKLLNRG